MPDRDDPRLGERAGLRRMVDDGRRTAERLEPRLAGVALRIRLPLERLVLLGRTAGLRPREPRLGLERMAGRRAGVDRRSLGRTELPRRGPKLRLLGRLM